MTKLKPIKITKRTRYKIKNQKFIDKLFEEMPKEITFCGMKFHRNTATLKPCYFYQEGFGKGYYGGSYTSFWIGFYQHTVEVHCSTAEDMCHLLFQEGNKKDFDEMEDCEKQCAKRIISILKKLNRYNYIELPKEKEKTQNANKNS